MQSKILKLNDVFNLMDNEILFKLEENISFNDIKYLLEGEIVNSDDTEVNETDDDQDQQDQQQDQNNQEQQNNQNQDDQTQQPGLLSPDQIQEIIQGLQSGQISEEEIQQAYENGQLNDADIQAIQDGMNQEMTPEQEEEMFKTQIKEMSENFVRLSLFDKINDFSKKVEDFIDSINDESLVNKFNYIKNYLDILSSLIFNLDVNLLFQMYVTLETKAISYMTEYLNPEVSSEELDSILEKTNEENLKQELQAKITPEKLIELANSGQLSDFTLQKLVELGIYTEDELNEILSQAQPPQDDQGQAPEGDQSNDQSNDKIDQAAQAIVSGEASEEELQQLAQSGEISQEEYQAIMNKVQELSNGQNEQAPEGDQSNDPVDQAQQLLQQSQQLQQQAEELLQNADQSGQSEDKITQAAQAIISGQLSADELIQDFTNGEITKEEFEAVIAKIEELKEQQGATQSAPENNNQEQPQQPQQQQQPQQPQQDQEVQDNDNLEKDKKEKKKPKQSFDSAFSDAVDPKAK